LTRFAGASSIWTITASSAALSFSITPDECAGDHRAMANIAIRQRIGFGIQVIVLKSFEQTIGEPQG
jgi:hypothetical protein